MPSSWRVVAYLPQRGRGRGYEAERGRDPPEGVGERLGVGRHQGEHQGGLGGHGTVRGVLPILGGTRQTERR